MKRWGCKTAGIGIAIVISLSGCVSSQNDRVSGNQEAEVAQVKRRLDEIFDAAKTKDIDRLESYHSYGPKFSKFAEGRPRQDAEAARKGEREGFVAINDLSVNTDDLKIDVFGGDTAIATFLLDYKFRRESQTITNRARATLVFVREGRDWKITHEHLSNLAQ